MNNKELRHIFEQRACKTAKPKITDEVLFSSAQFKDYIQSMSNMLTPRRQIITFLHDPKSDITAFTDGNRITINTANSVIKNLSTQNQRALAIAGMIAHECAHIRYSDFYLHREVINSLKNGFLYEDEKFANSLVDPDEQADYAEMEAALEEPSKRELFCYIYSQLSNILADVHDEAEICKDYGGIIPPGINMTTESLRSLMPPFEKIEGNPDLAVIFQMTLGLARFDEIIALDEDRALKDERMETVIAMRPYLEAARIEHNELRRVQLINHCILILWPVVRKAINDAENFARQLSQLAQQASEQTQNEQTGQGGQGGQNGQQSDQSESGQSQTGQSQSGQSETNGQAQSQSQANQSEQGSRENGTPDPMHDIIQNVLNQLMQGSQGTTQQPKNQPRKPKNTADSQANSKSNGTENAGDSNSNNKGSRSNNGTGSDGSDSNANGSQSNDTGETSGSNSDDKNSRSNDAAGSGTNAPSNRGSQSNGMEKTGESNSGGKGSQLNNRADSDNSHSNSNDSRSNGMGKAGDSNSSNENSQSNDATTSSDSDSRNSGATPDESDESSNGNSQNPMSGANDNTSANSNDENATSGSDGKTDEDGNSSEQKNNPSGNDPSASHPSSMNRSAAEAVFRAIKEQLADEMSHQRMEEAVEEQLTSDALVEIHAANQTSSHIGLPLRVVRMKNIRESTKNKYNRIMQEVGPVSQRLQKRIANIIADMREGGINRRKHFGRIIEARKSYRVDGAFFANKKLPQELPDMAIAVLIDQSGSMSGKRIETATKAAILLDDFATGLNIPIMIAGHNTDNLPGPGTSLYLYSLFDRVTKNDSYRIADMSTGGANRDGMAINAVMAMLAKRPEEFKILIIISDGQPNDYEYGGDLAEKDIQEIVCLAKHKGIQTFAAAIGSDKERIQRIYGDGFIDVSDLPALPKVLAHLISKRLI